MGMKIPFHKPFIDEEDILNVIEILKSGWLTIGPKTEEFEKKFKTFLGAKNAICLSSCTAAIHLAIKALGIKAGMEIVTPAINFISACEVALQENILPILVDIDKHTGNININSLEKAITTNTKGMILVHFGGNPCEMDKIMEIAKDKGLFIIEDAAHALPSYYKGKIIGVIGDIGCFSFYATKTMTTGEGGMAVTNNDEYANKMRILRLHGISKDAWKRYSDEGDWYYEVIDIGYKYNLTDIQAALGLSQLTKLEWMWERRKEIARRYIEAFKDIEEMELQSIEPGNESSWHLFPIFIRLEALKIDRRGFINILKERGIGTSVHFIPIYRHPYYRKFFNYEYSKFPNSEWFYEREISLPIYPSLAIKDQEYVIENILDICKRFKR